MERTIRELRGEACLPLEQDTQPRQRILVSRSFGHDVNSYSSLEAAITYYASRAGEKLRQQKHRSCSIYVFIHTNPHKEAVPQYKGHTKVGFDVPTDDPIKLAHAAAQGLRLIYKEGYCYKRGGIMLEDLVPEHLAQYSLFSDAPQRSKLGALVDAINEKMGAQSISVAASTYGTDWQMNQNHRSPRYTTRWLELPTAC